MSKGNRKIGQLCAVIVLGMVIGACSSSSPSSDSGDTNETDDTTDTTVVAASTELVVALSDTTNMIELHSFRSTAAYSITKSIYEPLLRQKFETRDDGLLVGLLEHEGAGAESYSVVVSPDGGYVATFKLRPEAKFSDGSQVTAADYKYTFDRSILGPGYIGLLLPFIGVDSVDQIKVIDDLTLEITTKVQSPLFERFMTFQVFGAINKDVAEANKTADDEWSFKYFETNGAGSGPYMIEKYDPENGIVLVPNPGYWDAANVQNTKVTVLAVPDATQRSLLLQKGELDLADGLPPKMVLDLTNDPNVKVYKSASSGVNWLAMNVGVKPFDNKAFRQAVLYAVPYEAIISGVMYGFAAPANGVVSTSMETYDASVGSGYKTDIELAKKKLAESKVDVSKLMIPLAVRESRQDDQAAAVLIQDGLRSIGVNVEVQILPDGDYASKQNANELPLQIGDWSSWGEDPFYQMKFLSSCGSFVNYARFCDKEYDKLIEEGIFSTDKTVRQTASSKAQKIFLDQAPWAPLWSADRTVVVRSCITGVVRDYTLVAGFATLNGRNC